MNTITTASHDTTPGTPAERPSRTRIKILVGVGAVIALGVGATALDRSLSDHERTTQTFEGAITSVVVDVTGGSVTVVGSDDPTVTVDAYIESGLRSPSHHETLEDGQLAISSHCSLRMFTPSCSTDYVIHVPRDVTLEFDADGADADVSGITGQADLAINGGQVDLTYDVATPGLKARANGGDIDVIVPDDDHISYRVESSSNGGSTDVNVRSDPTSNRVIDVHTNGGSISVGYEPDR
jgi:hypothetical protein